MIHHHPLLFFLTLFNRVGSVDGTDDHPPDAGKLGNSNARHVGKQDSVRVLFKLLRMLSGGN
jgi:hypothetical protein